jgi:hypothetical protein
MIVEITQKTDTHLGNLQGIQEPTVNVFRPAAKINAPAGYRFRPDIVPVRIIAMPIIVNKNPKKSHKPDSRY